MIIVVVVKSLLASRNTHSTMTRSELYLAFLPLVMSRCVDLLDNDRMTNQFTALERRTGRSGKDAIDHTDHQHDDVSNAVAGAVVRAFALRGDGSDFNTSRRVKKLVCNTGPQGAARDYFKGRGL